MPETKALFDTVHRVVKEQLYQDRVVRWIRTCFNEEIAKDKNERNHRFLEEALELVQSTGCTAEGAHKLVDYVFGRPVGDPDQEVGGTLNTLASLCYANDIDMMAAAEREMDRVERPEIMEKIRAKQKTKPPSSPLPGGAADASTS